jgi:uncharacterized membrane protein YoaK (UPF0700 family)
VSSPPEPGLRHAALMSLAAGFVDAHGYFRLGHVFTANMTGNSVLLSVALADNDWNKAIDYVETIALFIAGALAAAIVKRLVQRGYVVLLLAAAILAVLCVLQPGVRLSLGALAFAMGRQGGSLARFRGHRVQTVVLTSVLVHLAEGVVERAWPGPVGAIGAAPTIGLFALVWICYGLGAAGAVLAAPWTPWPLAVPALLLAVTALDLAWRRRAAKRALTRDEASA